ncbi:MAG: SH3 domain-containing protein [Lachnospiraceae bacterium]|nr:SH3 domain-containing protein [Lachnospiraceae bacterium]
MNDIFNGARRNVSAALSCDTFDVKTNQIRNVGKKMKRSLNGLFKIILVFIGICLIYTINAKAGVEDYEYPHYVGVATATVNVREGAGVAFDQVTDASGKNIQLSTGDEVEILDEKKADDGIVWYHIAFTQKGVEYIGFSTSSYLAKDDDRVITPPPTPTPVPVEDEVVDTPANEVTPDNKAENENVRPDAFEKEDKTTDSENKEEEESSSMGWTVFWLLVIVTIIFFGLYLVLKYIKNKKEGQSPSPSRKVERFKQMNMQNKDAGRRVPQIRQTGQRPHAPSEPRREVYVKRREPIADNGVPINQSDMEQDNEDKKLLREKIEHLQEHDLVRHVVYGEGEVYDNSDVKLLEVRFGNDMRFLKKDQLVNKRELVVFDDEDQSIARRRRRRVNNQNNRNY